MYKLAGIRVNRFFDYSKRMADDKGRHLVENTYKRLMKCIQEKLETKNSQNFAKSTGKNLCQSLFFNKVAG